MGHEAGRGWERQALVWALECLFLLPGRCSSHPWIVNIDKGFGLLVNSLCFLKLVFHSSTNTPSLNLAGDYFISALIQRQSTGKRDTDSCISVEVGGNVWYL